MGRQKVPIISIIINPINFADVIVSTCVGFLCVCVCVCFVSLFVLFSFVVVVVCFLCTKEGLGTIAPFYSTRLQLTAVRTVSLLSCSFLMATN